MEQVLNPPCDVSWFQAELDKITADRCVPMRIKWAPELTIARVISNDGTMREYAKYPLLYGEFFDYTRGVRYLRMKRGRRVTVGYQKAGDRIIPRGVKVTDIAVPDIVHVNPSAHLFVVERQLPMDRARAVHNEKRNMSILELGMDIFGAFPAEGHWDWFMDISEHRYEFRSIGVRVSCCEVAELNGAAFCRGLYRPPDQRDLAEVRRSVAFWLEHVQGNEDDTNVQDRMANDLITDTAKKDRRRLIDILERAGKEDQLRVAYEHSVIVPELPKESNAESN